MAYLRLFSAVFSAVLIFSSCAADSGTLFGFRNYPSSFTIRFPSPDEEVVCSAVMDEQSPDCSMKLTVTYPERSAGISVTCGYDSCAISADGTEIPLSAEASRALRDIFLILSSETPEDVPTRSSDGGKTVLESERGTLVLGEDLLPCSVVYTGMDGESRNAVIENFTSLINTDNTDAD